MTVFDDALALEMTVGKETWEPNTNLDYSQVVGRFTSSVPIRAKQESLCEATCSVMGGYQVPVSEFGIRNV